MNTSSLIARTLACALLMGLGACATKTPPPPVAPPEPPPQVEAPTPGEIEQREETLEETAKTNRDTWKNRTFKEFEASVYREPFEGGKYIVNGDTPIRDKKLLREFFDEMTAAEGRPVAKLIVNTVNGLDTIWNTGDKRRLTYCVSNQFGSNYNAVVTAMTSATNAWEAVADIDFAHVMAEDTNCTASNGNVKFDVRPVNVNGQYLARAFFPNDPRPARNVLIDKTSFELAPSGKLTLVGILRHELGHTLGFRHEHTRPDSGKCFEDRNWRPLTSYDAFSVMHYPQCNGMGDWSLTLTERDKSGSACLYGATPGFTVDTTICTPPTPAPVPGTGGQAKTDTFVNQRVNRNQTRNYGSFTVKPGTLLEVKMTGIPPAGDPDLYVRFGDAPNRSARLWSCRPYLTGAEERCALDVPAGQSKVFVMVHGYTAANYKLTINRIAP